MPSRCPRCGAGEPDPGCVVCMLRAGSFRRDQPKFDAALRGAAAYHPRRDRPWYLAVAATLGGLALGRRRPGRPKGSGRMPKEHFERAVTAAVARLRLQRRRVTQQGVAEAIGLDITTLEDYLRDYNLDWEGLKFAGD